MISWGIITFENVHIIFINLLGSLKLPFLMCWDIVWEALHEVFIKSQLFLISTVSCATIHMCPLYVTLPPGLFTITTTHEVLLYILCYTCSIFVNIFEDNCVDRNGETQYNYSCISINKYLKNTHVF